LSVPEQIILPPVDTSFITIVNHRKNGSGWFPVGGHNQSPICSAGKINLRKHVNAFGTFLPQYIREYVQNIYFSADSELAKKT
jgi:hypothetical protein